VVELERQIRIKSRVILRRRSLAPKSLP